MFDFSAATIGKADFHTHSTFSDGDDTAEEMVRSAIAKGLTQYGLSDHSCTPFDPDYCMGPREGHDEAAYRAEVARLKEAYAQDIELFCGIEQDIFSPAPDLAYDYVIGSVHYVEVPHAAACAHSDAATGRFFASVDEEPWMFEAAIDEFFGGDPYALVEAFFALEARVVEQTGCDLIGHFDLVKKYNGGGADGTPANRFFDEMHPRYRAAWQKAADALLEAGVPFEINSSGVRDGRTAEPYPSAEIQAYLRERGAVLVNSSDAHRAQDIAWHE